MVDVKISELPVAGSAAGTDQLEANQAGTSRSITVAQVGTALALTGYAPLASPVFTGDPQAPTPATADSDTSVATTAFVKAQGYQTAAQVTTSLGSYLPLTGGTLAGPGTLTGTAATFSGNVAVGTLGGSNNVDIKGTNAVDSLIVRNTAGTKFVTVKPETSTDTATLGYFLGAGFGTIAFAGPVTGTTATFSGTVSAPGAQIQMVFTETGAVATGTTIIPADNTIPQQTEGDQYMSLAITPKSATSKLIIEVTFMGSGSVTGQAFMAALFQDAAANALAVGWTTTQAGTPLTLSFRHIMTSGATSSTTFKVRAGSQAAATTTFNGAAGGAFMGGTLASSIVIREVA